MTKEENLQVGEKVMVRWGGSRKYYQATVLRIKAETCHVEYEDGTQKLVSQNDLQRIEVPGEAKRGRGRKKTPSPEKPGRRRSTSRGRRSKTPSSPPSTPERRSPGRPRKTPSSPETGRGRSPGRPASRSPSRSKKSPTRRPPDTPPIPPRGKKTISETSLVLKEVNISLEKMPGLESSSSGGGGRYPIRKRVVPGAEIVGRQEEKGKATTESRPFQVNLATSAPSASVAPVSGVPTRCPKGATLFSLLVVVLLAVLPLYLYLACTKNKGRLFTLPPVPKRLQSYLSPKTLGIYLAWVAFQSILMLLPLGKMALPPAASGHGATQPHYRMNGLYSLLLTAGTISAMAYYQLPLSYFNENMLRTIVTSLSFAVVVSVFLYSKSFFTDSRLANNSGNILYDFVMGRELNPHLWKKHFDLKHFALRLGLLGMATVDSLLTYKYFLTHDCVSPQLATVTALQMLYVVDVLWREESLLATSTFLYEGIGYALCVTFLTFIPFVDTLPVLYLSTSVNTRSQPWWCLASAGLLFLCGLYLSRKSLSEKYAFKSNPLNPALSHLQAIPRTLLFSDLETIPKNYTRRLISSGLWGMVRHPNYLGEILMILAWTLPCGFSSAVPYVPLVHTAVWLVLRTFTTEDRMRRHHGQAWTQYKEKVRYRLVPYVF